MNQEAQVLKAQAEEYKALYKQGLISRKEAALYIKPYIDFANNKSKELAKKYNVKPKLISLVSFLR